MGRLFGRWASGSNPGGRYAVTLSIANHAASLPIAYRPYLPEDWAADPARRAKTGGATPIGFATKPEIALEHSPRSCCCLRSRLE